MFALVDCNNFYVSCERVFNPKLNNKPVVILSNNDGCIIARSNEAKALGIPMGAPLYLYRKLIKKNNVIVYSSNYSLYGDISSRVMRSFNYFTPNIEIYSIDEAFLDLNGFNENIIFSKMLHMKEKIYQWTGIPVSVGIGKTKTLAKLANKIAKKSSDIGVYQLYDLNNLSNFKVEDIWGISKGWKNRLNKIGITTALQLKNADPRLIRTALSVVGERMVYELRGIPSSGLEEISAKKSITVSRSFGTMIKDLQSLKEALANHISTAGKKLRTQGSLSGCICVFINTNKFRKYDHQYNNSGIIKFNEPVDDTAIMIREGFRILNKIYDSKFSYKKIGVTLIDLTLRNKKVNLETIGNTKNKYYNNFSIQASLFRSEDKSKDISNLRIKIMDRINDKMGNNTIFFGSQGLKNSGNWRVRSNNKSPSYTTNWEDLVRVN